MTIVRRVWYTCVGTFLGLLARVWLSTLRVRVEAHPSLAELDDVPWILAFFHGTQWPLLAWRRRKRTVVLVSLSHDGSIQAAALSVLGFTVVRGSSSRGGARGLVALVRRAEQEGLDAAFAVDGPRGPYGSVKPGVFYAARRLGGVVVPMGSATTIDRRWIFARAWDRFALAWPFSKVAVVLGEPLSVTAPTADGADVLQRAVVSANTRAARICSKIDLE